MQADDIGSLSQSRAVKVPVQDRLQGAYLNCQSIRPNLIAEGDPKDFELIGKGNNAQVLVDNAKY